MTTLLNIIRQALRLTQLEGSIHGHQPPNEKHNEEYEDLKRRQEYLDARRRLLEIRERERKYDNH